MLWSDRLRRRVLRDQLGLELGDGPVTASAGYAGHIGSEWQDHSGQITVQIAF